MFLFLILFLVAADFGGALSGVDSRDSWRDPNDIRRDSTRRSLT